MGAKSIQTAFITTDALRCALQVSDCVDAGDAMDRLYISVDAEALAPTSVIATDLSSAIKVQILPEPKVRKVVLEADACEVNRIAECHLGSEVEISFIAPGSIAFNGECVECIEARLPVLKLFQKSDGAHRKRIGPDVDLRSICCEGYVMLSPSGVSWFDAVTTGLGCLDLKDVSPEVRFNEPSFDATTVIDAGRLSRVLSCFSTVYALEVTGGRAPVRLFGASWRNLVEAAIMPVRVCE